mmetsp:Transcript_65603/g.129264  ORF Transcript_65603/g.129264 Transcript_65603/m.129264 type:complete len:142 (+) Transcript_65603:249-674(+)
MAHQLLGGPTSPHLRTPVVVVELVLLGMGLQRRSLKKRVLVPVPASVARPGTDQQHLSGRGAAGAFAAVVPHGVVAAVAGAAGGAWADVAAGVVAVAVAAAVAGAAGGGSAAAADVGEGPAAASVALDSQPVVVTAKIGVY